MKHLTIPIMEFVQAQPAHKLPVVFTLEKVPMPDCPDEPEAVFQEVLRLEKDGLIVAHVMRDVTGKPKKVEVRYVTLDGKRLLGNMDWKDGEKVGGKKAPRRGIAGIVILAVIIIGVLAGLLIGAFRQHRQESPAVESPAPTATPTPTPEPTPMSLATPTLEATPSPTASPQPTATPIPSPSPTPTPLPSTSPSPSGSPKNPLKKTHSFTGGW